MSACAGVGTAEAVWAAIFLMIFHTVSKSTLFLCVGTVEHRIGSRNIEDMDGLFSRLPHLTRFMMLGIMGMFVAPFGMLVSKWATLVSFAETGNVLFLIMLAFGSAATFFYWAKWLGKLSGVSQKAENQERASTRASGRPSVLSPRCCSSAACACLDLPGVVARISTLRSATRRSSSTWTTCSSGRDRGVHRHCAAHAVGPRHQ